MAQYGPKAQSKVEKTMKEFQKGELKDSHGHKVSDHKQAIAIGIDEARREGAKVPKRRS